MAAARPAGSLNAALLSSWRGLAYCHVPADEPLRLDRLVSADGDDDRWNRPGEPTLYLAIDVPTAVGELARRVDVGPRAPIQRRRLLGLSVELDGLVDLRRPEVRAALGFDGEEAAFRDQEVARDVAGRLRDVEGCHGLVVPSMAFLDEPDHGNLVVFMDRGPGIEELVRKTVDVGIVELRHTDATGDPRMTKRQPDRGELRKPADPGDKDQPAEGGREQVDADLDRLARHDTDARTPDDRMKSQQPASRA